MTTPFDPQRYKTTTRAQWEGAAEAWHRWGPAIERWLGTATQRMLDGANLDPGGRVLDVAAGAGGQSIAAARRVGPNGHVRASVTVRNTGSRAGDEVVQLYLHDPVASISQPVRRLRGFERVTLKPGESRAVTFTVDRSDFGFYDNAGRFVVEPGTIELYAGDSSTATLTKSFTVTRH